MKLSSEDVWSLLRELTPAFLVAGYFVFTFIGYSWIATLSVVGLGMFIGSGLFIRIVRGRRSRLKQDHSD